MAAAEETRGEKISFGKGERSIYVTGLCNISHLQGNLVNIKNPRNLLNAAFKANKCTKIDLLTLSAPASNFK